MVTINPFNGRKDLLVTFLGNNDKIMAMFRVVAIDFRDVNKVGFLAKYENFKPYENDSFTNFEKEVHEEFKKIGALTCQTIHKEVQLMDGEIKSCKVDVIKDW